MAGTSPGDDGRESIFALPGIEQPRCEAYATDGAAAPREAPLFTFSETPEVSQTCCYEVRVIMTAHHNAVTTLTLSIPEQQEVETQINADKKE
jgi:hypothetical protein